MKKNNYKQTSAMHFCQQTSALEKDFTVFDEDVGSEF